MTKKIRLIVVKDNYNFLIIKNTIQIGEILKFNDRKVFISSVPLGVYLNEKGINFVMTLFQNHHFFCNHFIP